MDKLTYLAQLAEGLARWVPERERQDILRYYAEYFEEAGAEREAEVIQELGDPWALSSRLAVEGGYVTQEQAVSWTPKRKRKWPWVLAVSAVVVVFIIGSVATAAARLGRAFGRSVAEYVTDSVSVPVISEVIFSVVEDESVATVDSLDGSADFASMEDGDLEEFSKIDIDIGLGNVTVTAADDYTLFIDQKDDLGGYHLTWKVSNGTLKITGTGKNIGLNGFRNIDVIITVPDTSLLDRVTIKTGLGDVFLSDVAAKKVEAETGMGNVECYEIPQAKSLDLESGMGDVSLYIAELYAGVEIDLETGMGNVEAGLGCAEQDCEYELKSGLGSVTVDGVGRGTKAEAKGSKTYELDAVSGMGNVDVCFTG